LAYSKCGLTKLLYKTTKQSLITNGITVEWLIAHLHVARLEINVSIDS